jgi:hypothetical protein
VREDPPVEILGVLSKFDWIIPLENKKKEDN